jgi:hypothetical protein
LDGGFDRFRRPVWSALGVGNGSFSDIPSANLNGCSRGVVAVGGAKLKGSKGWRP